MWYGNLMKTSSFSHTKIFQNSIETKSLVFHDNYLLKHCYRSYDFRAIFDISQHCLSTSSRCNYHINSKMNDPTFLRMC